MKRLHPIPATRIVLPVILLATAIGLLLLEGMAGKLPPLATAGGLLLVFGVVAIAALRHQETTRHSAFLDALDRLGIPLLLLDEQGRPGFASPAFLALCDKPDQQSLATLPAIWQEALQRHWESARLRGSSPPEELQLPAHGEPARMLRLHAQRLSRETHGGPVLLQCTDLSTFNTGMADALAHEHALRTRHQHFIQTLIDVIPQPVYVKDEQGRFVLVNDTFCARHKRSRQDLIGKALPILPADVLRAEEAQLEELRVMAGTPIFREEHLKGASDELFVIISKQSCLDAEGRRVLVGTQIDITPWRKAEQANREALARETERSQRIRDFTQRLLDVIPEPVFVKDTQARYVMINEAFCRQRAQGADDILGRSARELAPDEETAVRVLAEDRAVLAGDSVRKEEQTRHPLSGQDRWRIVTKGACLNAEGEQVIIGASFDITPIRMAERQQAELLTHERQLRERTQNFVQRLIDVLPHPVYVKDTRSRFRMVNEAFVHERCIPREEILGQTPDQVLRRVLGDKAADYPPDVRSAQLSFEEDQSVLQGERISKEVHDWLGPGGRESDRLISKACCENAEGEQVIVCAQIDITPWRSAERELRSALGREREQLRHAHEFMQRLLNAIPYPVFLKNPAGQYLLVNDAFASETALSRSQILGRTATDLGLAGSPEAIADEDARVLEGDRLDTERQDRTATGAVRDRLITKRLCQDIEGKPIVVGAHIDVSALREAERALRAARASESEYSLRSQAFLQRLLDVLPVEICVLDTHEECRLLNQSYCRNRLGGRGLADLPEPTLSALIGLELSRQPELAEDLPAREATRQALLEAWRTQRESKEQALAGHTLLSLQGLRDTHSGTERQLLTSLSACLDASGKPVFVRASLNLTELLARTNAG
ncbi:MAG: hypothetical protein CGU28_16950 [Candidatus Dactylopiibacterium carminicum]|nr:MAG: hypothetical protein CGU28_16950 [Candidatus Dactylopiibacterium carminicum]